ncbi:MAG: cation-translocating P-type ATPase [Acutalibacteraceae bacterium]
MTEKRKNTLGLSTKEAKERLEKYGRNELVPQKKESFFKKLIHIICEPMFLLLLAAAVIYFILGEPRDGAIMLIFVVGIISIDAIQEWKTDKTLNALKDLSAPHINVIRDGYEQTIASAELVPGDVMLICEGVKIPADGIIIKCNDLCVDESSLTGEAQGVWKISREAEASDDDYWRKDYCYAGTLVTQGSAHVLVDKTGVNTEYGKIGKNVSETVEEKTPLQKQTGSLVKLCAGIAAVLFALVSVITYINLSEISFNSRIIESILSGVTLAMAMIPEEFPVILTVFLSMGAWRLAKKNSLVRRLPSVETLGAVSVLCVDKTGTITMNKMTVQDVWALNGDNGKLTEIMGLGCETDAYDPMEKAMLTFCKEQGFSKEKLFDGELIKEYAFTNELKMMGHIWRKNGKIVIAAKGSPEKILTICNISDKDKNKALEQAEAYSSLGMRVIAVAVAYPINEDEIPDDITLCRLEFLGLISLEDLPRESVKDDISVCVNAGIRVVMITGDNGITASSIARKIGMKNCSEIITGDMLNTMSDDELREKVKTVNIFSRVIPEHKMRIVKAFKDNGEIVAMTGDGVNDAPALKNADIGIAMGHRGSEVSREAADLILMDDNFTTIVETVKDGRRIYDNIRKAVGYIFTIHIPIALSSLLAPFLGIDTASLFLLPLHIVLLELIIDPTCSVVLERQPAERDIMSRKPRNPKEKLLKASILIKSVIQGLVIFAASFGVYFAVLNGNPSNAPAARAMGLAVIMLSNLFLVYVNSSDKDFAFRSFMRLSKDKVMWGVLAGTALMLAVILYTPLSSVLKLAPLTPVQLLISISVAAASVIWYELVKLFNKLKK